MNRLKPLLRISSIWLFAVALIALGSYVGCGGGTTNNNNNTNNSNGNSNSNTNNTNNNSNDNNQTNNNNTKPQCTGDGDCPPGQTCQNQKCVEQVDKSVETVEVIPATGVTRKGQKRKFEAAALNKAGARLAGPFTAKWSSSDADVAAVDQNGEVTGGSKSGTATITAEIEGKKGTAEVTNFGDVEAGKVRVIVLDGNSKAVAGAKVMVSDKSGDTDASGSVVIDGATPPFDLHVFHKDYSYFSAYGVNKTDLFVQVLKPQDTKKAGGVEGDFNFDPLKALFNITDDKWPNYNVSFGIAGLSLSANILELNFDLLLGESVETKLPIVKDPVDLPGGVVIAIGTAGKVNFKALGEDGKRLMWGFGGKFQIGDLTPLIEGIGGGKDINVGEILVKAKPLLQKMAFGFDPNVNVTAGSFAKKTLTLNQKLENKITVNANSIPKFQHGGKDVELIAISLAGVMIPGLGLVPTGLMVEQGNTGKATLEVQYAKRSGVLADGQFAVVTLALTLPLGDNPPPLFIFGNIQTFDSPPTSVDVSSFAALAKDAKFDPAARKLTAGTSADASLYHFTFTGANGKQWTVVYPKGADSFTLPAAPSGFDDPISADGEASFRSVVLKSGVTMDTILEFNDTNMDQLTKVLVSFSNSTVYEKPKK